MVFINLPSHFSFQRSETVKGVTNYYICFDSQNPDIINGAHSICQQELLTVFEG